MQAVPENKSEPVKLSYSLTRPQRVLNPLERLIFALSGTFVLGFGTWGAISAPGIQRLVIAFVTALPLVVLRKPMVSFYRCLFAGKYINTVEVGSDGVVFGADGLQAKVSRGTLKVAKGLCGTFVVRSPYGYSLVIPMDVISFERLSHLIKSGP
jgi:hypothetical protein